MAQVGLQKSRASKVDSGKGLTQVGLVEVPPTVESYRALESYGATHVVLSKMLEKGVPTGANNAAGAAGERGFHGSWSQSRLTYGEGSD